jgi:hypothetical protein
MALTQLDKLIGGDVDVQPTLAISDKVWKLWNSGADRSEFPDAAEYDRLEKRYGCACIPTYDVYGFRRITDERRRQHHGLAPLPKEKK